jgi:hypothetical protein
MFGSMVVEVVVVPSWNSAFEMIAVPSGFVPVFRVEHEHTFLVTVCPNLGMVFAKNVPNSPQEIARCRGPMHANICQETRSQATAFGYWRLILNISGKGY